MQRCPNCRASYQEGSQCRRCGMELASLLAVETAVDELVHTAVSCLTTSHSVATVALLQQAISLQHDPFAELLLAFAHEQSMRPPYDDRA